MFILQIAFLEFVSELAPSVARQKGGRLALLIPSDSKRLRAYAEYHDKMFILTTILKSPRGITATCAILFPSGTEQETLRSDGMRGLVGCWIWSPPVIAMIAAIPSFEIP